MMDSAVRKLGVWAEDAIEDHELHAQHGTRLDLIRRMGDALRWLGQEQPYDAIGNVHGIKTRDVYPVSGMTRDLYHLRAVPHTSTGKPALQIVLLESWMGDRRHARDIPEPDQRIFSQLVDRLTHGKVLAAWSGVNGGSFFSVAVNLRVHPSLMRAVTFNASSLACSRDRSRSEAFSCPMDCGPCPYRAERMERFIVPEHWT